MTTDDEPIDDDLSDDEPTKHDPSNEEQHDEEQHDEEPTEEGEVSAGDDDEAAAAGAAGADSSDERAEPLGDLHERVVEGASEEGRSESGVGGGDADSDSAKAASFDDGVADSDRSGPLGDVASGIDERRRQKTRADDELFESMDVGDVDSDALWQQVEEEETVVSEPGNREIREIDKHKYCKKCPYFAEPPGVHCTNEGTDILEQVDMDQFKVADCPVVLEDERLEDVTTE